MLVAAVSDQNGSIQPTPPPSGAEEEKQPTPQSHAPVGWTFWLQWVLANAVAGFVGGRLGGLVVAVAWAVSWIDWLRDGAMPEAKAVFMSLPVFGALIGIAQWFVLWGRIRQSGWWVLATIVGGIVGAAVVSPVVLAIGEAVLGAFREGMAKALFGALVGTVFGASVGIMQWLVLRRQVYRAEGWVLASTVAWAVSGAVGTAVVVGIILGAFTGIPLLWLLRHPVPEA